MVAWPARKASQSDHPADRKNVLGATSFSPPFPGFVRECPVSPWFMGTCTQFHIDVNIRSFSTAFCRQSGQGALGAFQRVWDDVWEWRLLGSAFADGRPVSQQREEASNGRARLLPSLFPLQDKKGSAGASPSRRKNLVEFGGSVVL